MNGRTTYIAALAAVAAPDMVLAHAASPVTAPPMTVSAADVLNVGGSLAMVLLAVVVIGWLYSRAHGVRSRSGQVIQVIASQALGPKERVLIVDIAGQQLVLGVTAAGMRTLHVLEAPVEAGSELASMPGFAARLGEALKKRVS